MRKFLKSLKKGLRTACVAAALATCWNVGQSAKAAYQNGDIVNVQFSGTISPTVNDLSHVFLIYCTGTSGSRSSMNVLKLGDFAAGETSTFSVTGEAVYDSVLYFLVAGVYGDITAGQYTEGTNGVTLNKNYSSIWNNIIGTTEETMFEYLCNDNVSALTGLAHSGYYNYSYIMYLEGTRSINLYDFSDPTENGTGSITATIVPEPITILLFGSGGVWIIRRWRREN